MKFREAWDWFVRLPGSLSFKLFEAHPGWLLFGAVLSGGLIVLLAVAFRLNDWFYLVYAGVIFVLGAAVWLLRVFYQWIENLCRESPRLLASKNFHFMKKLYVWNEKIRRLKLLKRRKC